jgi:hypothetical protein
MPPFPTNESSNAGPTWDSAAKASAASQTSVVSMSGPNWSNFCVGPRRYRVDGDGIVRGYFNGEEGAAPDDVSGLVGLGCTKA